MTTQIKISENIVKRVMRNSNLKDKNRAVENALEDYLRIKERSKILDLFGTIDFREGYNYKSMRNR